MDSHPLKSLEESALYEASKKEIIKDARRFDDAVESVTFAITRKPEDFAIDRETGIQIAKTYATENNPSLTIYFKEYENKIVLLDVEITKDGDSITE